MGSQGEAKRTRLTDEEHREAGTGRDCETDRGKRGGGASFVRTVFFRQAFFGRVGGANRGQPHPRAHAADTTHK